MSDAFRQGLLIMGIGMAAVFLTLILVGLAVALIGRLPDGSAVAPAPEPVPLPAEPPEIDPETLFVIASAVAAYLGLRARVVSVRPVPTPPETWAQAGRAQLQESHNLPPGRERTR